MRFHEHPDVGEITLTAVLSALADPLRLGVVCLLADGGERQWGELDVPVSKSTLSHHLKTLRSAGVTRTRDEGTRCYVSLRAEDLDARFPGLLASVVRAAAADVMPVGLK
jgi:DNA-binding transcriptional ArsR family regulator